MSPQPPPTPDRLQQSKLKLPHGGRTYHYHFFKRYFRNATLKMNTDVEKTAVLFIYDRHRLQADSQKFSSWMNFIVALIRLFSLFF